MDTYSLEAKFEAMGARLRVGVIDDWRVTDGVRIDVKRDRKGEYFDLAFRPGVPPRTNVLDMQRRERHLLLMVTSAQSPQMPEQRKQKFLCGHDERAWFVAAVPESAGASNVRTAMEALKPWAVRHSQDDNRVRFSDRNRRKNAGFVRQGEWYFVPEPHLVVPTSLIVRNEPIQRTGGKPHVAEFASRFGGEVVYADAGGHVLSAAQYRNLTARNANAARKFALRRRNARMVVRGRISHPDHATIVLRCWHWVWMNTEHESHAMRSVAFID